VALSSLAFSISVGRQAVPASHQMGLKNESECDFFMVRSSIWFHFVPSTSTYLERAQHVSRAGAQSARGESLRWGETDRGILDLGSDEARRGTRVLDAEEIAVNGAAGCCSRNPCGLECGPFTLVHGCWKAAPKRHFPPCVRRLPRFESFFASSMGVI
jgi:hypothetical protein